MNTHDKYELPPLPEASIVSYQTDSTMRSMELRTHSDEDMRDYARAAIEADRKRRGEPVAWSGWGCQYPGKMPRLYGDRSIAEVNCDRENGDQLLYLTAASQPAEPVKVPSDAIEELAHRMCLKYIHSSDPDMRQYTFGKLTLYEFARALLERYGQK